MRKPFIIGLISMLSGCSTLSAGDCLHANWYQTGQLAGEHGRPISEVLQLQNACVHYGVVPDREAFARGWAAATAGQAAD